MLFLSSSAMASGVARSAINAVLDDKELLQASSPRIERLQVFGKNLLERVIAGDAEMTVFEEFSDELLGVLRGLLQPATKSCLASTRREMLWSTFHQACLLQLPMVWERLLASLGLECDDDLLQQSTNQKLLEMIIPSEFSSPSLSQSKKSTEDIQLSRDELNALRYACGYVPHALLKRYEKRTGSKYDGFIECLGSMAVQGDSASEDFLSYTREWIDKVNRGGLFPLNDATYHFFVSVEKEVHVILPTYMTKPADSKDAFKESVIKKVQNSEEVQWNWTLISQCMDAEEDATELLREIVTLWVTIRGFSITAMWMEAYKRESKKSTKKTPGLRKGLSCSV